MVRESQCPPIRERASKTSTSQLPARKYAAATPPAPAPMTATRSRLAAAAAPAGPASTAPAPSAPRPAAPLSTSRRVSDIGRAYGRTAGSASAGGGPEVQGLRGRAEAGDL